MAARKLTAKERRELPARAFGIPSSRKYPVMVLNRSGEAVPSKGHAVDAKGRAKEELEKGRIDRRQYNQIIRKATAVIRAVDRKKARKNPTKKKAAKRKAAPRKATKKKATRKRRKNPHYEFGSAKSKEYDPYKSYSYGIIVSPDEVMEGEYAGIHALAVRAGDRWANVHPIGRGAYGVRWWMRPNEVEEVKATSNPGKKKATRKRRKNPTEAQHEAVGIEALKNSEEYWRGYMADKSKTNLLVDAYKFLVIAHEELKYSGNSEPRLQADHMLKAAHKELSKMLK